MGLFANFVGRVMERKIHSLGERAERAGQKGVDVARGAAPVRTGRLRESIGFLWNQSTLTLTIFADAPYAHVQEIRRHFMKQGRDAALQIFTGGNVDTQFATLDEKYHAKAKRLNGSSHTIIGHRKSLKFRR